MRIALGCDHGGVELKTAIGEHLAAAGHEIEDLGTHTTDSVDYPDFGRAVALRVASGDADRGVLVCGTGQGMAMTANKVEGVRAGVCGDVFSARMIRNHNDARVLCLGARVTGPSLALEIVDAFVGAEFEGGRHARRVAKIG
jgi:ribose 5-phosphate isomerase B